MARAKTSKKSITENSTTPAETAATLLNAGNGNGAATNSSAPKKSKKTAIAKNGAQSVVIVPMNLEDEIRRIAYLFAERRGFIPGHEADDWLAAEREVLQRHQ
jgi:hypothetical protein